MKIVVDYNKCTALGICESLAPEVFEVDDRGLVVHSTTVAEHLLDNVRQAVDGCPTAALRLEP